MESHASPCRRKFLTKQNTDNNIYNIDFFQSSTVIIHPQQLVQDLLNSLQSDKLKYIVLSM